MASQALAEALSENPHLCVEQGDVFRFFPQWISRLFLGGYGWVLRHCPVLYALQSLPGATGCRLVAGVAVPARRYCATKSLRVLRRSL